MQYLKLSLSTGIFPDKLKIAKVSAILKDALLINFFQKRSSN